MKFFLPVIIVMFQVGCDSSTQSGEEGAVRTIIPIESGLSMALDRVRKEPCTITSYDNSEIEGTSAAIAEARKRGVAIIPLAIEELRKKDVTIEEGVKMFLLCDQILRDVGGPRPIYTFGPLGMEGGRIVRGSRGDEEDREHIRVVVSWSIERSYAEWSSRRN